MEQGVCASRRKRPGASWRAAHPAPPSPVLWADQRPRPTFSAGLRRGQRNAGVMLPLSGEERDGPGSGKCVKTRNRAAAGLSQRTWAQEVPPAPSGSQTRTNLVFPKTQSKRRGLSCWDYTPHLPHPTHPAAFLCSWHRFHLPSHTADSFFVARGGPLEAALGVTWSIGSSLALL